MPKQSEQIDKLYQALAQFQKEMQIVNKDKMGKYSYASLPEMRSAIQEHLDNCSLCFKQSSAFTVDGSRILITTLTHWPSSQFTESYFLLPPSDQNKNVNQGIGESITYCRRYELKNILGLVEAEEDNDGEAPSLGATGPQLNFIRKLLKTANISEQDTAKKIGVESLEELTSSEANALIKTLNPKK
ncbi:MAG: ERF family protein [Candidatus Babeliales bacterium]